MIAPPATAVDEKNIEATPWAPARPMGAIAMSAVVAVHQLWGSRPSGGEPAANSGSAPARLRFNTGRKLSIVTTVSVPRLAEPPIVSRNWAAGVVARPSASNAIEGASIGSELNPRGGAPEFQGGALSLEVNHVHRLGQTRERHAAGGFVLGCVEHQGVEAAARPVLDEGQELLGGTVGELARIVRYHDQPVWLSHLAGTSVVAVNVLELAAEVLRHHRLKMGHVLTQAPVDGLG